MKEAKNNIQVNYGIWSWDDGILVGITEADQKDYEGIHAYEHGQTVLTTI